MQIRRARSRFDMERVWRLTHDEYVRMGYAKPTPGGMLKHFDLDEIEETVVWLAEEGDRALGTISITRDGPAGMHVDDDFKDVVDEVRRECRSTGKRLAAPWRIVTRSDLHSALTVSMGLINACVDYTMRKHFDVTLYTFNPRHQRFYKRMLSLYAIAGPRPSAAVENAPAVLMRGDLEDVRQAWNKTKARRGSARVKPALSETREYQPV